MPSYVKTFLVPALIVLAIFVVAAKPFYPSKDKARALYREGMAFKKAGRTEEACARFIAAISADSGYAAAYCALGDIYFAGRDYTLALYYGNKAKALGEGEAVNLMIGMSYYHLRQYDNALEVLEEAAALAPVSQDVLHTLAQVHAQLGNYRESIHYYQQCLKADSTHAQTWYELGMMQFNAGDYKSAVSSFDRAADYGIPQQVSFCFYSGVAALQAGLMEKCIHMLQKANRLEPANVPVLYNLAHAFYRTEQYKSAVNTWENVLKYQSGNAFAMYMLGKSYMGAGEQEKGERICDEALEIERTNGKE